MGRPNCYAGEIVQIARDYLCTMDFDGSFS